MPPRSLLHLRGSSAALLLSTLLPITHAADAAPADLVERGARWEYWDRGPLPDREWLRAEADTEQWPDGPAPLGYGDGDEATTVGFGSNTSNRFITTYFRHEFYLTGTAALSDVVIDVQRDDGIIVFVNGVEAVRDNLPDGEISFETRARQAVSGSSEDRYFEFTIDQGLLREGTNVIGVEIHQSSPSSSDISFDLGLRAETTLEDPARVSRHGDTVAFLMPSPPRILRYDIANGAWLPPVSLAAVPTNAPLIDIVLDANRAYVTSPSDVYSVPFGSSTPTRIFESTETLRAIEQHDQHLYLLTKYVLGSGSVVEVDKSGAGETGRARTSADFNPDWVVSGGQLLADMPNFQGGPGLARFILQPGGGIGDEATSRGSHYLGDLPLFVSADGSRALDGQGIVWDTAALDFDGSLAGRVQSAAFHPSGDSVAVLREQELITYTTAGGYRELGRVPLSGVPRTMFGTPAGLLLFGRGLFGADSLPIDRVSWDDFAPVATPAPPDPTGDGFTPDVAFLAGDRVHLFAAEQSALFAWDVGTRSYTDGFALTGNPTMAAYQSVGNTAYFGRAKRADHIDRAECGLSGRAGLLQYGAIAKGHRRGR